VSPAAALVARLRARGVALEPDGGTLVVRPADRVRPEEVVALKRLKPEVLALLRSAPANAAGRWSLPALDPTTLRDALGPTPDALDVAILRFDVLTAVLELEGGIATGMLPPRRLVRGRPLADWLSLDDVAALFRAQGEQR
jgi:hypothetical protein